MEIYSWEENRQVIFFIIYVRQVAYKKLAVRDSRKKMLESEQVNGMRGDFVVFIGIDFGETTFETPDHCFGERKIFRSNLTKFLDKEILQIIIGLSE